MFRTFAIVAVVLLSTVPSAFADDRASRSTRPVTGYRREPVVHHPNVLRPKRATGVDLDAMRDAVAAEKRFVDAHRSGAPVYQLWVGGKGVAPMEFLDRAAAEHAASVYKAALDMVGGTPGERATFSEAQRARQIRPEPARPLTW
jgi:hypothetical protein